MYIMTWTVLLKSQRNVQTACKMAQTCTNSQSNSAIFLGFRTSQIPLLVTSMLSSQNCSGMELQLGYKLPNIVKTDWLSMFDPYYVQTTPEMTLKAVKTAIENYLFENYGTEEKLTSKTLSSMVWSEQIQQL